MTCFLAEIGRGRFDHTDHGVISWPIQHAKSLNLASSSQSTSPFDLTLLPSEVSLLLLESLARICDSHTLLNLMRLSKESYKYFGPALYRNITITTTIFDGLDFALERRTHKERWDKDQQELVRSRIEEEEGNTSLEESSRDQSTSNKYKDKVEVIEGNPLEELGMVDPLSIHLRKVNLLSNIQWVNIQSIASLVGFSTLTKRAYRTDIYRPQFVEVEHKRIFDNLIGLKMNSSIKFDENSFGPRTRNVSTPPLKEYLRPRQIHLQICTEDDLGPGCLGLYFKELCEDWNLDLVVYHIQLANPSNEDIQKGNINYSADRIVRRLGDLPTAKKVVFDFRNSCTADPSSFNISPKTTAELYKMDGEGTSWEMVDLNCWNTLGAILSKVDSSDWIQRSSYSDPLEVGTKIENQDEDGGKEGEGKIEVVRPSLEIHGLPCITKITLDSMKIAASQRSLGQEHERAGWKEGEGDEWLRYDLKLVNEGDGEWCECSASAI
ncbi:hypothetical protein L486_08550 [Kwoniella mangroviensis CBS 10435]|uniref:Uncharacterized protein n=1 Tax=Kwoniella mangroviensis CBS 10435 TaxID=1331196 RepID=A0A1B9IEU4_9TREE|nr:hypothetical protein L486_08550 [Kwoniella mangroviensis CBS 10435]